VDLTEPFVGKAVESERANVSSPLGDTVSEIDGSTPLF